MKLDAFISILRCILLKKGNIEVYMSTKSIDYLYSALETAVVKDLRMYITTYKDKD